MSCNHDSLYRKENEAAGGFGCPLCNAQKALQAHQEARSAAQVLEAVPNDTEEPKPLYRPGCSFGFCDTCIMTEEACTAMAHDSWVEMCGNYWNSPRVYSVRED